MQKEKNATAVADNLGQEGKTIAIIAYLTLIGLLIAYIMNGEKKHPFASYHIRQSLGLMCTGVALTLVNIIPVLGWIVGVIGSALLLVLWIIGLLHAVNGKEASVPVVGEQYNRWFGGAK